MDLQYRGKHILVTAASRGLGKACALAIAQEGGDLILASRSLESLQQTAGEIKALTGKAPLTIATDVSKKEDIEHLFAEIKEHADGLDGLICNAGGPPAGTFLTFTDEEWIKAFETNLLSVIRLIRGAVPLMDNRGGGRIIAIASSAVKMPVPGLILSNTMRAGVQGLMKSLSMELASKEILLNTVCPARIATERLDELDTFKAKAEGRTLEEVRQELYAEIPLGRYGRPEEFAQLVTYLLSPANTYLTGSTYMVDGGMIKAL